ncbi:MAG: citrate transporter [Candidatus Kryptonium sp.]
MLTIAGIVIIFVVMALLMFLRIIPALIALPLMAFFIALIGGIPLNDILIYVIGDGAFRLHQAYTIAIFGGMLSIFMQKSGIAESFVRKGAELAGDNPFYVSLVILILTAVLFTTLGGLGAIVMVGTIVLPIMSSVGISPGIIAGVFLIGLSMGGILNAQNWVLYINILNVQFETVRTFASYLFFVSLIVAIAFIVVELKREGIIKSFKFILNFRFLLTLVLLLGFFLIFLTLGKVGRLLPEDLKNVIKLIVKISLILFLTYLFVRFIFNVISPSHLGRLRWYALLTPIVPVVIVFALGSKYFIFAFVAGLFYGFITTFRKGSLNLLMQSIIEGGSSVIPAVALMIGIGMLLNAILGPSGWEQGEWKVYAQLKPLFKAIVPSSPILYVAVFSLLSPLALYRGPLNVWGLGYGIATLISSPVGTLPPASVMGLLLSVGQIQGVCDPTNTHNVWIANELKIDVNQILRKTFPYMWFLATIGLVISATMFL